MDQRNFDRKADDLAEAIRAIKEMTTAMEQLTTAMVQQIQQDAQRNQKAAESQEFFEFRSNNPTQFKGGYDPEEAEHWIQELEKIFEIMACSADRRVTYATFMLMGNAEYWWQGTRRLLEAEGREITWEVFRTRFLERYFPTSVRYAKEMEFLQLRQGGMTVGDYAAKFESLSKYSWCPDEDWKCRKFEDGLRHEIKESVVLLEIREFPKLLDRCNMVEEIKKSRVGRPRDFGPSRFKNRDNKIQWKPYARPMGNQHSQPAFGSGGGSSQAYVTPLKCPTCGKAHDLKNYPSRGSVCFCCGKPGHYAQDCNKPKAESLVNNVPTTRSKVIGRVYIVKGDEAS